MFSHALGGVVSFCHSYAFYVGFVPLEYVQSIPPLSTFVIVIHTFREGNHVKKVLYFD